MKTPTSNSIRKFSTAILFTTGIIGTALTSLTAYAQTVWVDVRTPEEFATGHVINADNLPHEDIVSLATHQGYAKDDTILLYCRSGYRAGIAKQSLLEAGYTDVQNLGGFEDLAKTGAVKVSDDTDSNDDNQSD